MILTVLMVIAIFSFLVLAHEFGHFIVARRNGVQVDEFGIGFPPKVWGVQRGKTLYSVNLLPIGGFVRLKGEDGVSKATDSFAAKGAWVKSKILLAGVTINLLIAYVIITGLLATGMPPLLASKLPSWGAISPTTASRGLMVVTVDGESVAGHIGLRTGDRLLRVDGVELANPDQLRTELGVRAGRTINLRYTRNHIEKQQRLTLPQKSEGKALLGVATVSENLQRYPWYQAPLVAVVVIIQMILATLGAFGGLVIGLFAKAKVAETVTGPVGITVIFSEVVKYGAAYTLGLVASISLSLAIINSLPLPALDGGRLLVVALQRVGIKITAQTEAIVHTLGFVALIGLMIVVTVTDILRLK